MDLFDTLRALREEHGCAIVCMTRGDVEGEVGRELTEAEWDRVQDTWAWRKGFAYDCIMEPAWDLVFDAISDAGLTRKDEED